MGTGLIHASAIEGGNLFIYAHRAYPKHTQALIEIKNNKYTGLANSYNKIINTSVLQFKNVNERKCYQSSIFTEIYLLCR